jgi:hypothetical protein
MTNKETELSEKDIKDLEILQMKKEKNKENRASLTGEEKKLIDLIESVQCDRRYDMKAFELYLFARLHHDSLTEGAYDIFRYGYLKGSMAAENRKK